MPKEEHNQIVRRIQYYLDKQNMSQNKLAQQSNISQSTLNALMNRDSAIPKVTLIHKICDGLGITVKDFFDFPPYNSLQTEEVNEQELGEYLITIRKELEQIEKRLSKKD